MRRPDASFDDSGSIAAFLKGPMPFLGHYIGGRRWHFVGLFLLVLGGSVCSTGVQYVIKLLVDALAGPREFGAGILTLLGLVLALIAGESICARLTGWLGCRTTVNVGVDLRLDLFHCLSGQSMRYFAENLAGSLGQRITATAGNFGALTNTLVWRVLPPAVEFVGAVVIIATVDGAMTATLAGFVVVMTAGLIWFGERGRPTHRSYSAQAAVNGGDLVDTISNMWTVKAFSARRREWMRLGERFRDEAAAQRRSWMYLEKARLIHDAALWVMAGTMLSWALLLWSRGRATPGDSASSRKPSPLSGDPGPWATGRTRPGSRAGPAAWRSGRSAFPMGKTARRSRTWTCSSRAGRRSGSSAPRAPGSRPSCTCFSASTTSTRARS